MNGWLQGQRVLVTGGAGFIGSHLVDAVFEAGAEAVGVIDSYFLGKDANLADASAAFSDRLTIRREDAAEASALAAVVDEVRPDIVFNLATRALKYSFYNPAGACRVNLDIALNLGELQRAGAFGRLIHFSSSEVYGTAQYVPIDERHPMLAETSYAAGKAAADLLLASYVNMFGLDILTIRPFNNYGPRQNEGMLAAVIPLTIRRIMAGEPPVIEGDGTQTRDFIYVGDTIGSTLRLAGMDGLSGRVFNLGTGRETAIADLVKRIARLMSYNGNIVHTDARPADVMRHMAGTEEASALLGEIAPTTLDDGLRRTIDWYA